jgi:hypothetical protein
VKSSADSLIHGLDDTGGQVLDPESGTRRRADAMAGKIPPDRVIRAGETLRRGRP